MVYGGLLVSFFFNRQVVLNAYITIFFQNFTEVWSGSGVVRSICTEKPSGVTGCEHVTVPLPCAVFKVLKCLILCFNFWKSKQDCVVDTHDFKREFILWLVWIFLLQNLIEMLHCRYILNSKDLTWTYYPCTTIQSTLNTIWKPKHTQQGVRSLIYSIKIYHFIASVCIQVE